MIISACDPEHPEALALMDELSDTLETITGDNGKSSFSMADARLPRSLFVIAHDESGALLGCGALRPLEGYTAEIKRMYARPAAHGVGARVLAHLESEAVGFGYARIWLATRRVNARAVTFYRKHGYVEMSNFGKYGGRDEVICLGKQLDRAPATQAHA